MSELRKSDTIQDRVSDGASALCAQADFLLNLFGIMHLPAHCNHHRWDHPAAPRRPREGT
jgi:hypothetical protein